MSNDYRCPKCKSKAIQIDYPEIWCPKCGHREPLIDYPISWDWHRHYCREYSKPDPGPCEPPQHTLDGLQESISNLEEPGNSRQRDTIQQLQAQVVYLQNKVNELTDKKKVQEKTTGVIPL